MTKHDNILKIINEMFIQRDYKNLIFSENKIIAEKNNSEKICAFTKIIEKLNVDEIHNHINMIRNMDMEHCLIVYEGTPTPAVKNVIANTIELKLTIELFHCDDLQYNITKHKLVPKHSLLTKQETKEFKTNFGINIPVLLKTDPICKFYNFSKGDIIQITRRDGFISYRIVK